MISKIRRMSNLWDMKKTLGRRAEGSLQLISIVPVLHYGYGQRNYDRPAENHGVYSHPVIAHAGTDGGSDDGGTGWDKGGDQG